MTIVIDSPSPPLEKRSSKVQFAVSALQTAIMELSRCQGNDSSGWITGTGADGTPGMSLGRWMFDSTSDAP
jgi:hypothetical protein